MYNLNLIEDIMVSLRTMPARERKIGVEDEQVSTRLTIF